MTRFTPGIHYRFPRSKPVPAPGALLTERFLSRGGPGARLSGRGFGSLHFGAASKRFGQRDRHKATSNAEAPQGEAGE